MMMKTTDDEQVSRQHEIVDQLHELAHAHPRLPIVVRYPSGLETIGTLETQLGCIESVEARVYPSPFIDSIDGRWSAFGPPLAESWQYAIIVNVGPERPAQDSAAAKRTDRCDMTNAEYHQILCKELNDLYAVKNADYGDAFHITFEEDGFAMARIRLTDKLERFKNLTRRATAPAVVNEGVRDTLLDLANYALMTIMEMDGGDDGYRED